MTQVSGATYKREEEEDGFDRKEAPMAGAYKMKALPGDVVRWTTSSDVEFLSRQEPDDVIWADTNEEVYAELLHRYTLPDGLNMMKSDSTGHKRYWRNQYEWCIEFHPVLESASIDTVTEACKRHKQVLIPDKYINEMGGPDAMRKYSLVASQRSSRDAYLVKYSPRHLKLKSWKAQVQEVESMWAPQFTADTVSSIFNSVQPGSWPRVHPFGGWLQASHQQEVTKGEWVEDTTKRKTWGRRRGNYIAVVVPSAPKTILGYVKIARKLAPGLRPWRDGHHWRVTLQNALKFIHGVEKAHKAKKDAWWDLCKWLRAEARAVKIKVPPKPEIPAKPLTDLQLAELQKKQLRLRRERAKAAAAKRKVEAEAKKSSRASKRKK